MIRKLSFLSLLPLFIGFTFAHDCKDLPDMWRVIERQKADFQVRVDNYELQATYYNGTSSQRERLLNEYYELEEQRADINTSINYYNDERRWCDRQEEKYWDYLKEGGRAFSELQNSNTYDSNLMERGISNYEKAYELAIDAMLDVPNLDGLKDQISDYKDMKKKADAMDAEEKAQAQKVKQENSQKETTQNTSTTQQTENISNSSRITYDGIALKDYKFKSDELKDAIQWMYDNGLTKFNTLADFLPYDEITREQASKFFVEFAAQVLGKNKGNISNYNIFSDLKKADPTLKDHIIYANNMGLFKGSNGKFMPFNKLTKAQALAVIIRLVDGYQDESASIPYQDYDGKNFTPRYARYSAYKGHAVFYQLDNWGIYDDFVSLDSTNITRGDLAILIYEMYLYIQSGAVMFSTWANL